MIEAAYQVLSNDAEKMGFYLVAGIAPMVRDARRSAALCAGEPRPDADALRSARGAEVRRPARSTAVVDDLGLLGMKLQSDSAKRPRMASTHHGLEPLVQHMVQKDVREAG